MSAMGGKATHVQLASVARYELAPRPHDHCGGAADRCSVYRERALRYLGGRPTQRHDRELQRGGLLGLGVWPRLATAQTDDCRSAMQTSCGLLMRLRTAEDTQRGGVSR
jgi:hypothetical protein